jgi:hypothetical protein
VGGVGGRGCVLQGRESEVAEAMQRVRCERSWAPKAQHVDLEPARTTAFIKGATLSTQQDRQTQSKQCASSVRIHCITQGNQRPAEITIKRRPRHLRRLSPVLPSARQRLTSPHGTRTISNASAEPSQGHRRIIKNDRHHETRTARRHHVLTTAHAPAHAHIDEYRQAAGRGHTFTVRSRRASLQLR